MTRRPSVTTAVTSLAAILILAAGCSEPGPTAARLEPTVVSASRSVIGTQARVVHATYSAGTYSAVVTPSGGTLDFGIGSISFPAGAVQSAVRISATVDGQTLAVNFEPHGTMFAAGHEPTLRLELTGAVEDTSGTEIQYLSDSGLILERLPTAVDNLNGSISTQIQHFSPYAAGIGS
jgi:hypothetical protein